MSDKETVNVEISEGLIKPIIESKIQAAIVAEMSKNPEHLIDSLVAKALDMKVDKDGKISSYSSSIPYLEYLTHTVIRTEAKRALNEMLEENRDKIKDAVKKKMSQGGVAATMAKAMIDGMTKSLECNYSQKVQVSFKKEDD